MKVILGAFTPALFSPLAILVPNLTGSSRLTVVNAVIVSETPWRETEILEKPIIHDMQRNGLGSKLPTP